MLKYLSMQRKVKPFSDSPQKTYPMTMAVCSSLHIWIGSLLFSFLLYTPLEIGVVTAPVRRSDPVTGAVSVEQGGNLDLWVAPNLEHLKL